MYLYIGTYRAYSLSLIALQHAHTWRNRVRRSSGSIVVAGSNAGGGVSR